MKTIYIVLGLLALILTTQVKAQEVNPNAVAFRQLYNSTSAVGGVSWCAINVPYFQRMVKDEKKYKFRERIQIVSKALTMWQKEISKYGVEEDFKAMFLTFVMEPYKSTASTGRLGLLNLDVSKYPTYESALAIIDIRADPLNGCVMADVELTKAVEFLSKPIPFLIPTTGRKS